MRTRFRALASLIPVLLWRSDADGQHNSANEPWLAYTGQTHVQSQGSGWLRAIHPDDRVRCARPSRQDARSGT